MGEASLPRAVVVFGASGFVGRNVVEALRGEVECLVGVNMSGRPVPGCDQVVPIDALADLAPLPAESAIVNVAAFRYSASRFGAQQAEILAANQHITEAVYRFARARGIVEVRAASSVAVYPASWAVLEDARALDLNDWPHVGEAAYAWSKRWGEIEADLWQRCAGIFTISLRLTNPYGLYDTLDEAEAHVATAFVLRALDAGDVFEIRGDADAERDFVFAGDIACAFVESLRLRGVHTVVNCAFGQTVSIRHLAETAVAIAGRPREIRAIARPPGVKVRRATAVRLRELMPSLPPFRSLEAGLRLTMDWYRDALRG